VKRNKNDFPILFVALRVTNGNILVFISTNSFLMLILKKNFLSSKPLKFGDTNATLISELIS
jgi:hypothetical protein